MKIVEVTCNDCSAKYEALEGFPREMLSCPSCGSKELLFEITEKEFKGCGSSCSGCSSSCK